MDVAEAVRQSVSAAGAIRLLGRAIVGSNYRFIRREVARQGLDISHWKGQRHGTTRRSGRPLDELLIEGGSAQNGYVKRRLIREGRIELRCAICGMPPEWNGRPLTLRLDHVNGVRTDYRIENLRLLCPNCDSQTPTFAGRNKRRSSAHVA